MVVVEGSSRCKVGSTMGMGRRQKKQAVASSLPLLRNSHSNSCSSLTWWFQLVSRLFSRQSKEQERQGRRTTHTHTQANTTKRLPATIQICTTQIEEGGSPRPAPVSSRGTREIQCRVLNPTSACSLRLCWRLPTVVYSLWKTSKPLVTISTRCPTWRLCSAILTVSTLARQWAGFLGLVGSAIRVVTSLGEIRMEQGLEGLTRPI